MPSGTFMLPINHDTATPAAGAATPGRWAKAKGLQRCADRAPGTAQSQPATPAEYRGARGALSIAPTHRRPGFAPGGADSLGSAGSAGSPPARRARTRAACPPTTPSPARFQSVLEFGDVRNSPRCSLTPPPGSPPPHFPPPALATELPTPDSELTVSPGQRSTAVGRQPRSGERTPPQAESGSDGPPRTPRSGGTTASLPTGDSHPSTPPVGGLLAEPPSPAGSGWRDGGCSNSARRPSMHLRMVDSSDDEEFGRAGSSPGACAASAAQVRAVLDFSDNDCAAGSGGFGGDARSPARCSPARRSARFASSPLRPAGGLGAHALMRSSLGGGCAAEQLSRLQTACALSGSAAHGGRHGSAGLDGVCDASGGRRSSGPFSSEARRLSLDRLSLSDDGDGERAGATGQAGNSGGRNHRRRACGGTQESRADCCSAPPEAQYARALSRGAHCDENNGDSIDARKAAGVVAAAAAEDEGERMSGVERRASDAPALFPRFSLLPAAPRARRHEPATASELRERERSRPRSLPPGARSDRDAECGPALDGSSSRVPGKRVARTSARASALECGGELSFDDDDDERNPSARTAGASGVLADRTNTRAHDSVQRSGGNGDGGNGGGGANPHKRGSASPARPPPLVHMGSLADTKVLYTLAPARSRRLANPPLPRVSGAHSPLPRRPSSSAELWACAPSELWSHDGGRLSACAALGGGRGSLGPDCSGAARRDSSCGGRTSSCGGGGASPTPSSARCGYVDGGGCGELMLRSGGSGGPLSAIIGAGACEHEEGRACGLAEALAGAEEEEAAAEEESAFLFDEQFEYLHLLGAGSFSKVRSGGGATPRLLARVLSPCSCRSRRPCHHPLTSASLRGWPIRSAALLRLRRAGVPRA